MDRKKSVTTRIHQPPAPPCWFRTAFYLSFGAWVLVQAITEYYNTKCLHIYTHLPIFDNEKQVTAAFLNVMSVGLLTVCLVLAFVYGICTVSKLIVLSSSAFLSTLLILNVLAIGMLISSHFALAMGPMARNKRVLTIYHQNVSKENWQREMRLWAVQFPLGGPGSTTGRPTTGADTAVTAASHTDPAPDGVTPAAGSSDSSDLTPSPGPSGHTDSLHHRSVWAERRALHLLRFFQRRAYCCGVEGPRDYAALGAQTPPSCVCREDGHQLGQQRRPPCTARPHTLANGTLSAVWRSGCLQVKRELLDNLSLLQNLLMATAALQAAVMALGVVLGLNMPSSLSDDSDDEEGDY